MGISFAINVLDLIKGILNIIKKSIHKEEESYVPMPSEEEIRQEKRKRLEEQIKILNGKNKDLHYLAIRELEQMVENLDIDQELQKYICDCLCQYLSKHPDSRPAFNALFKKDRIFVAMEKEIKDAEFVKLKLGSSYSMEHVNFLNCTFYDCHFHKIHFRNCNMHGGEIRNCDFKDEIKFSECFFKDVHIDDSYFRHVIFRNLSFREGKLSSSVILRSELLGASFINVDMKDLTFQICNFQMELFGQCQMTNVKFKYKNNEVERLEMMQEYLSNMGYRPCVERSSMTLIT